MIYCCMRNQCSKTKTPTQISLLYLLPLVLKGTCNIHPDRDISTLRIHKLESLWGEGKPTLLRDINTMRVPGGPGTQREVPKNKTATLDNWSLTGRGFSTSLKVTNGKVTQILTCRDGLEVKKITVLTKKPWTGLVLRSYLAAHNLL